MAIPRIIHQTVDDKRSLHPRFLANISHLISSNPQWRHVLYDDGDRASFISDRYGSDALSYYNRINPTYGSAKADLFRYLAVYELGGVYLDIKSTATRPLDDVLSPNDEYLLSHWSNREGHPYKGWGRHHPRHGVDEEYQQWHIVAAAHHPFLEAVIERVKKNIDAYDPLVHGVGKRGVLQVTGPIAYTLAIQSVRQSGRFRLVDIEELGFQYSIFGPSGNHEVYFPSHYRLSREPIVRRADGADTRYDGVRRNELCPCGSNKRFKHCHGRLA
jgi:mannosyltransferase OCH1-like enzyme